MVARAKPTLIARESFAVDGDDGGHVIVHAGTLLAADDPIVKGREHLFAAQVEAAKP